MATYFCGYCDNYIDDDYHPCEVVPGSVDLICPACFEELEEEVTNVIEWKPGWYADRLHAFEEGSDKSLCGYYPGIIPAGIPWREKRLKKGPPKCKKCLKKKARSEEKGN